MAERRPSWRGHLKLSLVTCPVALYNAVSPAGEVHFHLINPKTGHRINTITVDAQTHRPVDRKDLVKGFEIAKGKFVTLTGEEINAVKLESTKLIDIDSFVPCEDIDRLYWDHPYFLLPDGHLAAEPFAVIRQAMRDSGQVGLARVVISDRERLVALEPRDDILIATTLRSHDEVRQHKALAKTLRGRPAKDMVTIATKIIIQKAARFDPTRFDDRYEDALRALIKRKRSGKSVVSADEPKQSADVIDLMEALKKSVGEKQRRNPNTPVKRAHAAAGKRARKTAKR